MVQEGEHIRMDRETVRPPICIGQAKKVVTHLDCVGHTVRVAPARLNDRNGQGQALILSRAGLVHPNFELPSVLHSVLTHCDHELTDCDEHTHGHPTRDSSLPTAAPTPTLRPMGPSVGVGA